MVRALVLAGETLFLAGPPDVVDLEQAFLSPKDPAIRAQLDEQASLLPGKRGAHLWAVSAADGKKLAEYPLASGPVWDGMAAAGRRLFVSTVDGAVLCFEGR